MDSRDRNLLVAPLFPSPAGSPDHGLWLRETLPRLASSRQALSQALCAEDVKSQARDELKTQTDQSPLLSADYWWAPSCPLSIDLSTT